MVGPGEPGSLLPSSGERTDYFLLQSGPFSLWLCGRPVGSHCSVTIGLIQRFISSSYSMITQGKGQKWEKHWVDALYPYTHACTSTPVWKAVLERRADSSMTVVCGHCNDKVVFNSSFPIPFFLFPHSSFWVISEGQTQLRVTFILGKWSIIDFA